MVEKRRRWSLPYQVMAKPFGPQATWKVSVADVDPRQRVRAGELRAPEGTAVVIACFPHAIDDPAIDVAVGITETTHTLPADVLEQSAAL